MTIEMSTINETMSKVIEGKMVTFEYICRKGNQVERYYLDYFKPTMTTPTGLVATEIVAWINGKEEMRMKLTKK